MSAEGHFSPPPVGLFSRSYPGEGLMADSPASPLADEVPAPCSIDREHLSSLSLPISLLAPLPTAGGATASPTPRVTEEQADRSTARHWLLGSSEAVHGASRDTREQEDIEGGAAAATSEPMREELVQSAVSFLKHQKVVASSDVQRRSFLENKGLTVDEIDEAFRRLLSPPSNSASSDTCKSQGASDHSCRITQQEAKISTECVDGSGTPDPETVTPVVPRHPKSYMEIMEMIQRGEQPDDIQDINDEPPNPDQPISEPRMAPKPKPWEIQGQESSGWDLKAHPSDSSEPASGVQTDSTKQATESNNSSDHSDLMLMAEPTTGSEAPADGNTPLKQ